MSLSPLVSFKSRFVTYLLNFPRTTESQWSWLHGTDETATNINNLFQCEIPIWYQTTYETPKIIK